jgi:hypothetical protein
MDFIESETLHQKVADRVAIAKVGERFKFYRDTMYQPAVEAAFGGTE